MSKKTVRKKATATTTPTASTVKNTSANVKNKKRKDSVKTTTVGTATSKVTSKVATNKAKRVATVTKATATKTTQSKTSEITCKTIASDQGAPLKVVQRHMSFFNNRPYVTATTSGSKVTYTKSSVKAINKIFNLISKGLTQDQVDAVLTAEYMKSRGVDLIAVADRAVSRVTQTAPTSTIGQTASTDDEVVNTYW